MALATAPCCCNGLFVVDLVILCSACGYVPYVVGLMALLRRLVLSFGMFALALVWDREASCEICPVAAAPAAAVAFRRRRRRRRR